MTFEIQALIETVKDLPNWLTAILGGAGMTGLSRVIRAIKDYRSAVSDDDRSDFDRVVREYRGIIDGFRAEVAELRREIETFREQNDRCIAENDQLKTRVNKLTRRVTTLQARLRLRPSSIAKASRR